MFLKNAGVDLEGSQSMCVPNFFEGPIAEEAQGEGWRYGGGKFIIIFLRKEGFEYVVDVEARPDREGLSKRSAHILARW